jgi:predicted NUDIX family NTP pyrophosphohydrolase
MPSSRALEMKSRPTTSSNRRSSKESAGILLYRVNEAVVEVLLAHPGGPYWRRRDDGAWTIPKGEVEPGEDELMAALREFAEETGYRLDGSGLTLGSIRQPGGKMVHIWAIQGDWDPSRLASGSFSLEWPPRSGRMQSFPEIDRADWFSLEEGRRKILKGQAPFLDRLERSWQRRGTQSRYTSAKPGPKKSPPCDGLDFERRLEVSQP